MESSANQELKNSMFENVFGYDQKFLPDKQGHIEEEKGGNLPISQVSTPYVAAGYDSNIPSSSFYQDGGSNFPEVVLEQTPAMMRASENQESARVIMETRVIQNLIYSYFGIVKKNISDMVPKTIMAFLINESRKIA